MHGRYGEYKKRGKRHKLDLFFFLTKTDVCSPYPTHTYKYKPLPSTPSDGVIRALLTMLWYLKVMERTHFQTYKYKITIL